jgi:hypothetical protein
MSEHIPERRGGESAQPREHRRRIIQGKGSQETPSPAFPRPHDVTSKSGQRPARLLRPLRIKSTSHRMGSAWPLLRRNFKSDELTKLLLVR